jgi:hypothetical protein
MITKEQQIKLEEIAKPVVKWLNDNCHPHVTVIITPSHVNLLETLFSFPVEEYILD